MRFIVICIIFGASLPLPAKSLIIYYANESSPVGKEAQNYDTVLSWLEQINSPKAVDAIKNIKRDRVIFQEVVAQEAKALLASPADVIILTNQLVRSGQAIFKQDRQDSSHSPNLVLNIPATEDPVYSANPLANPVVFSAVLDQLASKVASLSPDHLALIIKSHGNQALALTTRLDFWSFDQSKKELEIFLNTDRAPHMRRGIERQKFVEVIKDFQRKIEQPIDMLILESCGAPQDISNYNFDGGVRSFFTNSKEIAEYASIDYQSLASREKEPVIALKAEIRSYPDFREFRLLNFQEKLARAWYYFIPLIIVLFFLIYRRSKGKRQKV